MSDRIYESSTIYIDGGSHNNGASNQWGYGSFKVDRNPPVRLEFGNITNNEAEYLTLLCALGNVPKWANDIVILTDSQLIIGHINDGWRCKSENLKPLLDKAREMLAGNPIRIAKAKREDILDVLGH